MEAEKIRQPDYNRVAKVHFIAFSNVLPGQLCGIKAVV